MYRLLGRQRAHRLDTRSDVRTAVVEDLEQSANFFLKADVDERIEEYSRLMASDASEAPKDHSRKLKSQKALTKVLAAATGKDPIHEKNLRRTERENALYMTFLNETIARLGSGQKLSSLRDSLIEVDRVDATSARGHRRIYVRVIQTTDSEHNVLKALQDSTTLFRQTMARNLNMSLTPTISFHLVKESAEIRSNLHSIAARTKLEISSNMRRLFQFEFSK